MSDQSAEQGPPDDEHDDAVDAEVIEVDTTRERAHDDDGDLDRDVVDAEIVHFPVKADSHGMGLVPVQDELRGIASMAVTLATSNLVPESLRGHPENVLAVLLTGRELGVAPMTAIRTFHVIKGVVTIAPKVRAAMVRQQGLGKLWPHQAPYIDPTRDGEERVCRCGAIRGENDDEVATWHAERADTPGVIYSSTYTMSMARGVTAGGALTTKDNWKNYPARMLSWRALGYLLDDAFPEVGTGLYSPDEIGATTDEEGLPLLDIETADPLVPSSRAKQKGNTTSTAEAPANPATLEALKVRIAKLERYDGARAALVTLWKAPGEDGQPKLPPIDSLLYRQCKLASAMIDAVEKRCEKGEFGDAIEDAEIVADLEEQVAAAEGEQDGPDSAADSDVSADEASDGEPGGDALSDAPGATEPPFDVEGLPVGKTAPDDLKWLTRAPGDLVEQVAAEVAALELPEVVSRLKAVDLSAAGNENAKRARLAARVVRQRMERMVRP